MKPITSKSIFIVALTTFFLLLTPLVAMQFTNQVNWNLFDFLIAGVLLFGTGISFLYLLSNTSTSKKYKLIMGLLILAVLLLVWAELAVGIFD